MDVQHALLSKAILSGDLKALANARITADFFTDPSYQRVFQYIIQHWQKYGAAPGLDVLSRAFPRMEWEDDPQPIEYFIDRLRERRQKSILTEGLNQAAIHLKGDDPDSTRMMAEVLQDSLRQSYLETSGTLDIDVSTQHEALMELLDMRMEDPGYLRGISTGFNGIDYVTGGLQPEQFVVLTGLIKSFKSATALAIALNVHRQAKMPLFIGFEMSNTEQTDRIMSLLSGVSLTKIMNGSLNFKERQRIERALKQMEEMRAFILSSDISSVTTVSGVQAKIQEYDPDVVIIDGAYMMQSELPGVTPGGPQALTDISRSIKRLAQSAKKPILVTTQSSLRRAKGGVLSADSLMYTQAWGQDCDVLLGTERTGERPPDETTAGPTQIKLRVIESRSGPRKEVILEWDWHSGSVQELDPVAQSALLDKTGRPVDDGTGWES